MTLQGVSILLGLIFIIIAFTRYVDFPIALGLSATAGFIAGGQILVFSIVKEAIPSYVGGTATAFTNALVMAFPMLLQPLFGSILNYAWSYLEGSVSATGNLVYTAKMYEYAIFSFPLCGALSFALCFFIKKSCAEDSVVKEDRK